MPESDRQRVAAAIRAALDVLDATPTTATAARTQITKSINAMRQEMSNQLVDDLAISAAAVGVAAAEMQKVINAAQTHLGGQIMQAARDAKKALQPLGTG